METVRSLKINVDEDGARNALEGPAPLAWFRRRSSGRLARLALVYVPFWTFEVGVDSVTFRERYRLSLDAIRAVLDPYRGEAGSSRVETDAVLSGNVLFPRISEGELHDRIVEIARREVYRRGFSRIRELAISPKRMREEDFYVPYWLGFRGESALSVEVLNANSRRREGSKAEELFYNWLVIP